MDANHMTVLKGAPTVAERVQKRMKRYTGSIDRESNFIVFGTLNGWGDASWTKYEALQRLRWGGFKGYRTTEDDKHMDDFQNNFPVYHGGLFSVINCGDKTIYNGDLIYWDIPEDDDEARELMANYLTEGRVTGLRGERRSVLLRPYDAKHQKVNRRMIRSTVLRPYGNSARGEMGYDAVLSGRAGYVMSGNADFVECLKAFGALCIAADRAHLIAQQASRNPANAEEAFLRLKGYLMNEDLSEVFDVLGVNPDSRLKKSGHDITQALIRIAAPETADERLFLPSDRDTSAKKSLNSIQRGSRKHMYGNLIDRTLQSVEDTADYVKRRIIAKAMTTSLASKSMDIIAIP